MAEMTNMPTVGEIFSSLSPELVKKLEERKKQEAEKAEYFRKKYGFLLTDDEVSRIVQAEKENEICKTCTGYPCKKSSSQNPNWENVVKIDPLFGKVTFSYKRCKYTEQALLEKTVVRNFRLAKIPAKYEGKTFSDYLIDKNNAESVGKAKSFLKNQEKGLLLYGKPGRGKTFLATIIAQELLKQGKSVIFGDVPSLLEDLKSSYSKNSENQLEKQMEALAKADLVVLDDLGTEKPTEWAVNRLYLIINERYNRNKPLIVTSNYSSKEISERLNNPTDAKSLGVTGSRIVSRLMEMCEIVAIRGEDWRLKNVG